MINKNKSRLVLSVDTEKLLRAKKISSVNNTTLSDAFIEAFDQYSYKLTDNITLSVEYIGKVAEGSEFWRVDIEFLEAKTGKWLRNSWYELYVSETYIEGLFSLPSSPRRRDIVDFAFRYIAKRFLTEKNNLPEEYGAFVSSRTKDLLIANRQVMWDELEKLKR